MKNTLKRILETQELHWVSTNKNFTYRFQCTKDTCIDVNIYRIITNELIITESLINIFELGVSYKSGEKYIYYVIYIRGCEYFIKVTKEEDLYFQSLLQDAYKKYQLKLFEHINFEIEKSIEQKQLNTAQKFEKAQQDAVSND